MNQQQRAPIHEIVALPGCLLMVVSTLVSFGGGIAAFIYYIG